MTVRVYRNTDTGAPTLDGITAGQILNVLDKCLVAGYGAKAAAGWTKPYTGTNIAAFRMNGGSGSYIRVDDTNATTTYRRAAVRGYGAMTDVNTGTDPFPTTTQNATGLFWFASATQTAQNALLRNWCVIADETFFYFFVSNAPQFDNGFGFQWADCYFFGDAIPYLNTDTWFTVINGGNNATAAGNTEAIAMWRIRALSYGITDTNTQMYIKRRHDGVGGAVNNVFFHGNVGKQSNATSDSGVGNGALTTPNLDGHIQLSRLEVMDRTLGAYVRGQMPGMWLSPQSYNAMPSRWDIMDGAGETAGRKFFVWRVGTTCPLVESSDTWRA